MQVRDDTEGRSVLENRDGDRVARWAPQGHCEQDSSSTRVPNHCCVCASVWVLCLYVPVCVWRVCVCVPSSLGVSGGGRRGGPRHEQGSEGRVPFKTQLPRLAQPELLTSWLHNRPRAVPAVGRGDKDKSLS